MSGRMHSGGAKVYWTEPDHDEQVHRWIAVAMRQAEREWTGYGPGYGVGVIDFADCTVIVLTAKIPLGEVMEVNRRTENSILHGGFGSAPHRSRDEVDFTTNLVEVKNPHDSKTVIGVTGLKGKK
jgi:hypothetical protein